MADNQEEKIKDILTQNGKIELKEILKKLENDVSKQTFYNKIRKSPLEHSFIELIKSRFNIDLNKVLVNNNEEMDLKIRLEKANSRIIELQNEIIELLKKKGG